MAQTESLKLLSEASDSTCDGVRFGPEFCEQMLPSEEDLKRACALAHLGRKKFSYVTPRLSNSGIKKVRRHLALLNEEEGIDVVFNDLGTLKILKPYNNLGRHLGRQLIRVPARSPWAERIAEKGLVSGGRYGHIDELVEGDFLVRRWYNDLFQGTSLDFSQTLDMYRSCGVTGADFDWIPRTLPSLQRLAEQGLGLSVHLHLVPITVTRKCHTARFTGEKSPEECSRPCLDRAYLLKSHVLDVEMYLLGNTVFNYVQPAPADMRKLKKIGLEEIVLSMNPVTGIDSKEKIDNLVHSIRTLLE